MGRVTVFASAGCSHCARAKAFLDARGVPHAVIDLTTHPARLADQRALTGSSSVPQVLFNREVVGGADDLEALEAELGPDGFLERVREALAAPDPTTPRLALDATPPVDADGPVATPTPSRPPMPRHHDDDDEPIVATLNGVRFGFVAMIRELRSIVRVGDSAPRELMRVVQRRCFTGADLVTALLGKHPSDLQGSRRRVRAAAVRRAGRPRGRRFKPRRAQNSFPRRPPRALQAPAGQPPGLAEPVAFGVGSPRRRRARERRPGVAVRRAPGGVHAAVRRTRRRDEPGGRALRRAASHARL